jgi:hypothetical protein
MEVVPMLIPLFLTMLIPLFLTMVVPASAASFSSTKASAQTAGAKCSKKAHIEITDDRIVVECKKSGYARKLSELLNLRWTIERGYGVMVAEEASGDSFIVSVKKKEFAMLKEALLANLDAAPPKTAKAE